MNTLAAILFTLMPACPTEDSSNCKWDAQVQGNGLGHSFVVVGNTTTFIS